MLLGKTPKPYRELWEGTIALRFYLLDFECLQARKLHLFFLLVSPLSSFLSDSGPRPPLSAPCDWALGPGCSPAVSILPACVPDSGTWSRLGDQGHGLVGPRCSPSPTSSQHCQAAGSFLGCLSCLHRVLQEASLWCFAPLCVCEPGGRSDCMRNLGGWGTATSYSNSLRGGRHHVVPDTSLTHVTCCRPAYE